MFFWTYIEGNKFSEFFLKISRLQIGLHMSHLIEDFETPRTFVLGCAQEFSILDEP